MFTSNEISPGHNVDQTPAGDVGKVISGAEGEGSGEGRSELAGATDALMFSFRVFFFFLRNT